MSFYKTIRSLLFCLDAETAHHFVCSLARCATSIPGVASILHKQFFISSPALAVNVLGRTFPHPVGIAAGFDKNGQYVPFIRSLGFSFLEVGSVSYEPCAGNQRPRLFRLPQDEALINRMGLNNFGAAKILGSLPHHQQADFALGINITKTNSPQIFSDKAIVDLVSCYKQVAAQADFVVVNISCPNTPDGRTFEEPESLRELLQALKKSNPSKPPPLLVKLSPDLTLDAIEQAVVVCEEQNIDGYVLANTTKGRTGLRTAPDRINSIGLGGLSGKPLHQQAIEKIRFVYKLLRGQKPIIGVGGVHSAESAYALLSAGASLVELYTALVYEGPSVCKLINEGLIHCLQRDGFNSISQVIGKDHR